jgi:hypothetical protein
MARQGDGQTRPSDAGHAIVTANVLTPQLKTDRPTGEKAF